MEAKSLRMEAKIIQNLLFRLIVKMMKSTVFSFLLVFISVFCIWMLAQLAMSYANPRRVIDIAFPLIFSSLLALLAATVRVTLVKKYSKIKI